MQTLVFILLELPYLASKNRGHTYTKKKLFLSEITVLASVAKLIEVSSHNQKVVAFIPSHGTYLGYGFAPWSRHIREETNQCFSLT